MRIFIYFLFIVSAVAEVRIPGATAYSLPDADAIRTDERKGSISKWKDGNQSVVWYGQFKALGELSAAISVDAARNKSAKYTLTIDGKTTSATSILVDGAVTLDFGKYTINNLGWVPITLACKHPEGGIQALILDGPAMEGAHFNLKSRRNAASVHLAYSAPKGAEVTGFYNEIQAIEDPTNTFYMACGFSRGYFGMQVNSLTERRIIFSVWDAAEGGDANDRSTVKEENHTRLLEKGEAVHASVFGNEGTGGHSHLVYNWKTGVSQKFYVTAKVDDTFTIYSGYYFHPDKNAWILIASFKAPKDGKLLRRLHSFSENFWGNSGHVVRKARYGPQWIQTKTGVWEELLEATFSHDATGKEDRPDRFMGVEDGKFFLNHGGFVDGFTKFGELFKRPASPAPPVVKLP